MFNMHKNLELHKTNVIKNYFIKTNANKIIFLARQDLRGGHTYKSANFNFN